MMRGIVRSIGYRAILPVVTVAILGSLSAAAHAAQEVWVGDFETGDSSQYRDQLYDPGTYSRKTIVTSPTRGGKYAVLLEVLGKGRDNKERAELVTTGSATGGVQKFVWNGPEYWIGFSFRLKDWNARAWTFLQIHGPDAGNYSSGCRLSGNTLTIHPSGADSNGGVDNRIAVDVIEDGTRAREHSGAFTGNKTVWSEPLVTDVWHDFVVRMKLSTEGKGFYEVWKDGVKVYSKFNLTNVNVNTACGVLQTDYLPASKQHHYGVKIGVYSGNEPVARRIYFDEVRIAEGAAGYAMVAPPGSPVGSVAATAPPPPRNLKLSTQ